MDSLYRGWSCRGYGHQHHAYFCPGYGYPIPQKKFPKKGLFYPMYSLTRHTGYPFLCSQMPGIRGTLSFVYKCPGYGDPFLCLQMPGIRSACPMLRSVRDTKYLIPYFESLELWTTLSRWLELPEYGLPCPMLGTAWDTDYFILRLELPGTLSLPCLQYPSIWSTLPMLEVPRKRNSLSLV
jgi:hypothetical protein